jgi:branched-chain amino acid transport system substrate-binding protein
MMRLSLGLAAAAALTVLTGAAQAQYSDNKIKLGVLDDFSGPYCVDNCMGPVVAVQMAIDEFGGKINGVPIELIHGDHQDKPDTGVSLARRWYDTEQVDAILDVVYSAVALAVQEVAREKNKVVLYSEAGSDALTGKSCAPFSAQWTYDTYQFPKSLAEAMPKLGKTWFIISADYAYGKALAAGVTTQVEKAGGKVLGTVYHPFGAGDMSSFMLQAQASKAEVIALGNAGPDMTNSIKAAHEFGLIESGVKIVPLSMDLAAIDGAGGLPATQGMLIALPWYAGLNDKATAWAAEYEKRQHAMAPYLMAGLYSATRHYLQAIKDTGTDDPAKVFAKMRETPVNDAFTPNGKLRIDGRMVHDVYLVQVKKPAESTGPRDLAKLIDTIPGDKAFRPMNEGNCPLVK